MIFTLYLIFFGVVIVFILASILLEDIMPFFIALLFIFFIGSALLTTGVHISNFTTNVTNTATGNLVTERTTFTSVKNTSTNLGGSIIILVTAILLFTSLNKLKKKK